MRHELTAGRSAMAGLAGTGAVVAATRWARRAGLTRLHFPRIVGTVLGRDRAATRAAGWTLFVAVGAALPLGYRAALRLSGREAGVAAGAALGLAHGLAAAALAAFLSPLHPRPRRAGLLPAGRSRPDGRDLAILAAAHLVYGAVLGALARGRA